MARKFDIRRWDSPYSERTGKDRKNNKIMSPFACSTRYVPDISRGCTPSDFAIAKRTDSTVLFVMAETVGFEPTSPREAT